MPPAQGVVDPARYQIDRAEPAVAKAFVVDHHYSGSFPAFRFAYQLTDRATDTLAGAAVFGIPASARVLTKQ